MTGIRFKFGMEPSIRKGWLVYWSVWIIYHATFLLVMFFGIKRTLGEPILRFTKLLCDLAGPTYARK